GCDVALLDRGEEPIDQRALPLRLDIETWALLQHMRTRAQGGLADGSLRLSEDASDLRVLVVEHVAQEEDGALHGREALEQHEERHAHRLIELDAGSASLLAGVDQRLGQPLADVRLALHTRGAQL